MTVLLLKVMDALSDMGPKSRLAEQVEDDPALMERDSPLSVLTQGVSKWGQGNANGAVCCWALAGLDLVCSVFLFWFIGVVLSPAYSLFSLGFLLV